jgi:hypothetical protein
MVVTQLVLGNRETTSSIAYRMLERETYRPFDSNPATIMKYYILAPVLTSAVFSATKPISCPRTKGGASCSIC